MLEKNTKTVHNRWKTDENIEEPHRSHRKLLKDIWVNEERSEALKVVSEVVHQIVGSAENPFEAALNLHKYSCDFTLEKRNRIASKVIVFFEKWLMKRDDRKALEERFLSPELQKSAFDVATKVTFISSIELFKIFRILNENGEVEPKLKQLVHEKVQHFCKQQKFQEALQLVDMVSWHESYPLERFVIPCFLQKHLPLVDEFLRKAPMLRPSFVYWLDTFLPMNKIQLNNSLESYKQRGITPVIDQLLDKQLEKNIARLIADGHVGREMAPNFINTRLLRRIRYVIQIYCEGPSTFEARLRCYGLLLNLVQEGGNEVKHHLLMIILKKKNRDLEEVAWWWLMFDGMDGQWLPWEFRNLSADFLSSAKRQKEEFFLQIEKDAELVPKFLHDGYEIHLVDATKMDLFRQLSSLLLEEKIIGIDAEWEQGIMIDKVDLIQIACSNCVYLVDIVSLLPLATPNEWHSLLESLLVGPSTKLVFAFGQDVINLFNTFPDCIDLKSRMANILCLNQLVNRLLNSGHEVIDVSNLPNIQSYLTVDDEKVINHQFSLSYLYERIVGKALEKEEQTSPWKFRPLSSKQILYAARDAFSLFEIYNELKRRTEALGLSLSDFLVQTAREKKKVKPKTEVDVVADLMTLGKEISQFGLENGHQMGEYQSLKLFIDVNSGSFEKYLRQMGVNVLKRTNFDKISELAKKDPDCRFVIMKKAFEKLSEAVKKSLEGKICLLKGESFIENAAQIFREFRIQPKQDDLFTRCMYCNTAPLLEIPRSILHFIYHFAFEIHGVYAREEDFIVEDWIATLGDLVDEATVDLTEPAYRIEGKLGETRIDLNDGLIIETDGRESIQLHIENLSSHILNQSNLLFYACTDCGRLFWG